MSDEAHEKSHRDLGREKIGILIEFLSTAHNWTTECDSDKVYCAGGCDDEVDQCTVSVEINTDDDEELIFTINKGMGEGSN